MELTLTGNDHLAKLFGLLNDPCRVLLVHSGQESREFLGVRLGHRLDSTAVTRLRITDRCILQIASLGVQRVTRTGIFQFNGSTDIAGCKFIHSRTDRTGHLIELRDTLFATTLHVLQVVTVMDRTLHYAEVVHLTDMRFNRSLKDINAGRRTCIRAHFLTIYGRIAEVSRTRRHTVEEVHQTTNTHIFCTRAAEYRIHRTICINGLQTLHNLFVGQAFAQELIEQRLISFCSCLRELRTHFLYFVSVLSRDILEFRSTAFWFPNEHFALEHVDHCIETCAGVHRELDERTLIAKVIFELVERALEVSVLVITFVDNKCQRFVGFLYETEVILGTYLNTTVSAEHDECRSAHLEGSYRTAAEVIRTCAVDDIQFFVLELDVTNRAEYGITVLFLYREIVAHGRLRLNRSAAFDDPALEQHRLHKSRFTRSRAA